MISFRKKVFFSDLVLFFIFIVILFPFIDFNMGFVALSALVLLLYSVMTWVIVYRLITPIQKILDAILPYQQGKIEFLPRISINKGVDTDEFIRLAFTLNSLTEKIEMQIANLMYQKKETEGILQSLGEGVIALDTQAKATFANEVSCRLLGVCHDAILGHPLNEIRGAEGLSKKCHELILQVLQTSEMTTDTWVLSRENPLFLHLISMPRAEQKGAILVLQDKTSDYKMVQMGKDFIANASHELRTPITIIRGFAETLQDIPNLSPKMLKEITTKIVYTCERLNHLVKSLLILADAENFLENRLKQIDLLPLLDNCAYMLLLVHPTVHLSIQNHLPKIFVAADGDLLDLAIMNLLENSVKYSNPPVQIKISLEIVGACVQISITDQGIGISEGDLSQVFNRFYTVDKARSRKFGGAGLGLSIVKTIAEKHGGELTVKSEVGQGSTFTLSIPIVQELQTVL